MRRNKWLKWLRIIITIISPIFSFLGVSLFNMPKVCFIIIMLVGVAVMFVCFGELRLLNEKRIRLSKKLKKIAKEISDLKDDEDSEDDENLKYKIERLEKKYQQEKKNNSKLKEKYNKVSTNLKTTVIILILIYTARSEPIIAMGREIINVIIIPFTESNDLEGESVPTESNDLEGESVPTESNDLEGESVPTESNDLEGESVPTESNDLEGESVPTESNDLEGEWIRFTLEYPNGYYWLNDEEFNNLYIRLFYINENNLNEKMKSEIVIWLNSCAINNPLDNVTTSSGNSAKYFSDVESDFSNKNGNKLPSFLLDKVIKGREELLELCPNEKLAWLLANNYQTYALNYREQTSEEKSILFLYMKSIDYTIRSLEFDNDIETKRNRIKYLQSKYKDIGDCEDIDKDIRFEAYRIYMVIQDVLDEL